MSTEQKAKATGWLFWIISIVALIWNGMGCLNFFQQMSAAGIETLPKEYQGFIAIRPGWSTAAFAISVFAGLIGAILLMMRNRLSVLCFTLSCIGAIIATISTIGTGITSVVVGSVLSAILAALFAWYASRTLD